MSRLRTKLSLLPLLSFPLLAQTPPPRVTTDVVVSAAALGETTDALPVAATVVDRDEIERSKTTQAADLLRTVPGLDLVQEGGPGNVTSAFLRGTNSNETLFLVDGVKLNGPFFGNYDLSSLDTTNVERIEVVRGPFSALYGSDAIGGVVQLFTRRTVATGLSGRGTLGIGDADAREGTLFASYGEGIVQATAGFRRATIEGTLPNESFRVTNLSTSLELTPAAETSAGVVVRYDSGTTGIPLSLGVPTPHRSTAGETTAVSLPLSFALGAGVTLEASPSYVKEKLTFLDPDEPYGFTSDRTDAQRIGAHAVASRTFGAQRVSVGGEYERAKVTDVDAFGVEVDDRTIRSWAVFVEDRVALLQERLVATLGVRRDDHTAYGAATNPRLAVSFRLSRDLKLRAAAGSGFRSPTVGELYYPVSGNPGLRPERSTSYEVGAELAVAPHAHLETSLFWSSIRDLIQYDFVSSTDLNVGRARIRGAELALSGSLGAGLSGRVSYTWVDAIDRATGEALLRRPKSRASATLGWQGPNESAQLTAVFVGRRNDVDEVTFAHVEDPSYLRFDAAATGPRLFSRLAPWARVTNVLARRYAEAAGYPSPGRRFQVGLEVVF
jgi:vitamin B12 transporter